MGRPYKHDIRDRCPHCHSGRIVLRKTGKYYCRDCMDVFNEPWVGVKEKMPEKPKSSGNVAGKITIGRGSRWYSGAA